MARSARASACASVTRLSASCSVGLPATAVFVYAGTEIGQLTSLKGLISPGLLGAFALLGLL